MSCKSAGPSQCVCVSYQCSDDDSGGAKLWGKYSSKDFGHKSNLFFTMWMNVWGVKGKTATCSLSLSFTGEEVSLRCDQGSSVPVGRTAGSGSRSRSGSGSRPGPGPGSWPGPPAVGGKMETVKRCNADDTYTVHTSAHTVCVSKCVLFAVDCSFILAGSARAQRHWRWALEAELLLLLLLPRPQLGQLD